MYCSTCGAAVAQGLAYCNFCGAKLGGAKGSEKYTSIIPAQAMAGMVTVFIAGLVVTVAALSLLRGVGEPDNAAFIKAFAALTFLLTLGVECVFASLLLRRGRRAKETAADAAPRQAQTTNELDAAKERLLNAPAPSVTEHTTRAFDPAYVERRTK